MKKIFYISSFILLCNCSSKDPKSTAAAVAANTAAVVGMATTKTLGTVDANNKNLVPFPMGSSYKTHLAGVVRCESNDFASIKNYKVEIYFQDKLFKSVGLDNLGQFDLMTEVNSGIYEARLLAANGSKILDQVEINTGLNKSKYDILLRACR